jgi:hypothetical protein
VEAPAVIMDNRPPVNWPTNGVIQVQDLYVRYREDLDPVINGLTFTTMPCEKVRCCARTNTETRVFLSVAQRLRPACVSGVSLRGLELPSTYLAANVDRSESREGPGAENPPS